MDGRIDVSKQCRQAFSNLLSHTVALRSHCTVLAIASRIQVILCLNGTFILLLEIGPIFSKNFSRFS